MRIASTLLALGLLGCGARSALVTGSDDGAVPDGSLDAGIRDGGFDAGPDSPPPSFEVACSEAVMTTPGVPVEVSARVVRGEMIAGEWVVDELPPGSGPAEIVDPTSLTTSVVPPERGRYAFRFVALSVDGTEASCVAEVFSVDGPPIASCPGDEVVARVGEPVSVTGAGFDDEGPVAFAWRVQRQPSGARASLDGEDMATVTLRGDTAGVYVLELTVTDARGESDRCNASVRLTAPPVIECPSEPILAPTRQPVTVSLPVSDDTEVVGHAWEMTSKPPRSAATLRRRDQPRAVFTPDRQGPYELVYTATDSDGLSSSCTVTVVGTPTPPTVMCPEVVETPPLSTVSVTATATDDGDTLRYRWQLVSRESGSAAAPPTPRNADTTEFTPDIAGEYLLRVTVTDDDGESASCETLVEALVDEGLRVEMFWNTDDTDMDVHLAHPRATRWFSDDDCYYANCDEGSRLNWGGPGTADDPRLDIDDTNGFGPENINIDDPELGVYTVGVHAFAGRGDVTVRIYCGGSSTEPEAEFGATPIGPRRRGRDFWRVADVAILAGGRCTVTERRSSAGGPDIISDSAAMTTR